MDNKRKNKLFYLGVLLLLLVLFCIAKYSQYLLKKEYNISNAYIYSIRRTGRSDMLLISFNFNADGKIYKSSSTYSGKTIPLENIHSLTHRHFPVMYYPLFPKINTLLLLPIDFEQYGLPYPDSLKWVLPLIKK